MVNELDMEWLQSDFPGDDEPGNRKVFGVIQEARVGDPGTSAFFVIKCSDGAMIEGEFVYLLNPCEAVGGLVLLELTPDNRVGARRFKAVEDMHKGEQARLEAEERTKRKKEKLRNTLADKEREWSQWRENLGRKSAPPKLKPAATFHCQQGTIRLHWEVTSSASRVEDIGVSGFGNIDYSALQMVTTGVKIEILPADLGQDKLTLTLPAAQAVELIGGTDPCTATYESIYKKICERRRKR